MRVFDLAAASPITPPVPTLGMVQDAIMAGRGRQLIVRDARGVRSWQLPAEMLSRTLIPVSTKQYTPLARGGAASRLASVLPPFETRSDGRLLIATKKYRDQNIRLETWDGQPGRLESVKQLPDSESRATNSGSD